MKLRATMAWKPRDGKRRRIRLFEAYCNMLGRCRGGKSKDAGKYWNVGAHGWDNWEHFRAWALANGYAKGKQLDRKRSDMPYGPDNCQWLTQAEHKAKTHPVTCLCAFCRRPRIHRKHTKRSTSVRFDPPDTDVPF